MIRRETDERGAILVIAAIAMTMILAATALSFDIGREVDTNRIVQSVADAVALDAANFVDNTPPSANDPYTPIGGLTYQLAQVVQYEATQSAARNNVSAADQANDAVVLGSCSASGSNPCATFNAVETCPLTTALPLPGSGGNACSAVNGADPNTNIDSVRMTASSVTDFAFEPGNATSSRSAVAKRSFGLTTDAHPKMPESAFSIGSTLLDLSNPLVDSVLSQELGTSAANISVLSYSGLVGATVSLGDILAANPSVGTMSSLLNTGISSKTALGYYANALVAQGTPAATAAATPLQSLIGSLGSVPGFPANATIQMCKLVDLSAGQTSCGVSGSPLDPAAYAQIDAGDFLTGVATLAGAGHALSLNIGLAQLLSVTVTLVTPMATAGPGPADQPSCPTGYTNCPVTATDTQGKVNLSLANLNLGLASVGLSIKVSAANATGTLTGLTCGPSPASEAATISGTTNAATLSTTFNVSLLGSTISDTEEATVGASTFTHTFDGPFVSGQPAPYQTTNTSAAITIPPPSPSSGLGAILTPLTSLLNATLDPALGPILSALGVNLGYATLIDNYVNCDSASLVG